MNEFYEEGRAAYRAGFTQADNPYYENLDQNYFDWNNGWWAAEEAYFDHLDACESQEWEEYLAENGED